MSPFRTVGGRLGLALLLVVGGALAIVYLIVVPSFQQSLANNRLADLRTTLELIARKPRTAADGFPSQAWIEHQAVTTAAAIGARVVLYLPGKVIAPIGDSNAGSSSDVARDPMARRAAVSNGIVSGSVARGGSTYAEAAESLGHGGPVLLLAASLHSERASVDEVRHRVELAGIIATGFAIVLGYSLALLFARRIRRLEVAAERIADGHFDESVIDTAPDELGQLARTFDRMRVRLATLDRARGEFIANASHELRTPLFSLAGFLELLTGADELDRGTHDEFLATMRDQVSRLTKLATDLLDLSRMDAGKLAITHEWFDLSVAGDVLATEYRLRAAVTDHPLTLRAPAPVLLRGDEGRVIQIGRILLENAITHTPPGTAMEISAALDHGRAVLAVSDDGPGIPPDAQRPIFERFYRLSGSIASGSGLGLAIAHELAELMDGRLIVESRPGRTRFALELPTAAVSAATAEQSRREDEISEEN